LGDEVFSISAKRSGHQVYYYVTKRVRGRLFKTYVGKCGEVTAGKVREAIRLLRDDIAAGAPRGRRKGARSMRGRENVGFDLLQAYQVVLEAAFGEQQDLYETWRENTSQTLALVLSPEECEAWNTFSSRDIDWSSSTKVALELKSTQAFLRALITSRTEREKRRRAEPAQLDRFTRRATQVMMQAQAVAKRFNQDYIGSGHLLVGLAEAENSTSSRILGELGVTAGQVQEILAEMTGQDTESRAPEGGVTLPSAVKRTFEAAVSDARDRGHYSIDSAHLLLGLVEQEDSTALAILQKLGVSPEAVREATEKELDQSS
jgi:hypothetical protein